MSRISLGRKERKEGRKSERQLAVCVPWPGLCVTEEAGGEEGRKRRREPLLRGRWEGRMVPATPPFVSLCKHSWPL